jgi:hypothetical protein
MALAATRLPYGLRDVKVATVAPADGTKGTLVDLPNAQTFEFEETTTTQSLRGDDTTVAQRTTIDAVAWTLEAGGINYEAMVVMAGGAIVSTGTTPAIHKTWTRLGSDVYPDFFVEGQSMSESGGDDHTIIPRAKASKISGSHTDGEFWVTHAEGTGIASIATATVGQVWQMASNETALGTV